MGHSKCHANKLAKHSCSIASVKILAVVLYEQDNAPL
jgi:hypothetical protein